MITATTSDNSEEMITFIIFNRTGIGAKATFSATLSADATLQALHEKVAEECEIVPGTFELRRAIDETWRQRVRPDRMRKLRRSAARAPLARQGRRNAPRIPARGRQNAPRYGE